MKTTSLKLKRYEEPFEMKEGALWDSIASYMDDEIREDVHAEMAPCSPMEFLEEYLKRDEEFVLLLWEEFDIETNIEEIIEREGEDE